MKASVWRQVNRDLDDQEVLFMWRMFRAAILGVLIGIVGGVIFGQVSYVKKYKDKVSREIMADAVMYNNSLDDSGRVIRLKVDYDGNMKSEDERDELESYVGNTVMKQIGMWLGDDYNENLSYIQMRHNLVMAMEDINDIAHRHTANARTAHNVFHSHLCRTPSLSTAPHPPMTFGTSAITPNTMTR